MGFGIISAVTLHVIGPKAWRTPLSFDMRDLVEQRQQLGNIVTVRLGKDTGQGDAVGIGEQMVLASQFPPIRGIWASFCASARCAHRGAVHERAIPIDLVGCLEFRKQLFENALPNACLLPLSKTALAGLSGGEIAGCGKPPPWNTRPQHEEDTRKNPAWLTRFPSRELDMTVPLGFRDQWFQTFPETIRQNGAGHSEDLLCGLRQIPADAVPNELENV